jgi:hypothetical protein
MSSFCSVKHVMTIKDRLRLTSIWSWINKLFLEFRNYCCDFKISVIIRNWYAKQRIAANKHNHNDIINLEVDTVYHISMNHKPSGRLKPKIHNPKWILKRSSEESQRRNWIIIKWKQVIYFMLKVKQTYTHYIQIED